MINSVFFRLTFVTLLLALNFSAALSQIIPISNFSVNSNGQAEITVYSTNQNYYVLKVRHDSTSSFDLINSFTLGKNGATVITESLEAYPLNHYQVVEYNITNSQDIDGDSINDLLEYQNFPVQNPINSAPSINRNDGILGVDSLSTFQELSITKDQVPFSEFLNGKSFVKYIITDFFSDQPKTYFINSGVHNLHADFGQAIGINHLGTDVKKGQIIYHPKSVSNNGTVGNFAFNYSNGHGQEFDVVQRTQELLAANMPFLTNNLSYFVTSNSEDEYTRDSLEYINSRVSVLFEKDVYASVDFWGLNYAEGFGLFRKMDLAELPNPRDIVLYEAIPNSLPRVGGIVTSVVQTPLSHVNLRAIQNNIPNAYIKNPLAIDSIADLIDNYIYYKVEQGKYTIRLATVEEVNNWYNSSRPSKIQNPPLNLDYKNILPLDNITFEMSDGFGAKCANVATMLTFDFPLNTIPNGFGVPFSFYQEFMEFNNLNEDLETMFSNPEFIAKREVRDNLLDAFRKKIKNSDMPLKMLNQLDSMHKAFPAGTSVRCRSSSNNEDLPGFNGAGLYTSKTQHPHEGHISKSIKQVYASLWNLRAYEEREFYKIDHFTTSMGVLCHPNYKDEKSNGVGLSIDPIYNSEETFYLNSQVGEELVTNPDGVSVPEEILLYKTPKNGKDFLMVQRSNLIKDDTTILEGQYLNQIRNYLSKIHSEFEKLYEAEGNSSFAMDIEYKITKENQLIIKQARPWVSFTPKIENVEPPNATPNKFTLYPNPAKEVLNAFCKNCNLNKIIITNTLGNLVIEKEVNGESTNFADISLLNLKPGVYILSGFDAKNELLDSKMFVKR